MFGCERGNWPTHPQQAYKDNISKIDFEEELEAMEEQQAQNIEQELKPRKTLAIRGSTEYKPNDIHNNLIFVWSCKTGENSKLDLKLIDQFIQ